MKRTASDEVLTVYELAVEMADRVSTRRGTSNQFYLALQTLLLGVPAAFASFKQTIAHPLPLAAVLILGAVISLLWWLQLRAYRDLNREKFAVIQQIERQHLEVQPYVDEWRPYADGGKRRWRERYRELGQLERAVPLVFLCADVVAALIVWL